MLPPETALFLAIDIHCRLQNMNSGTHRPRNDRDEVVYYVNRDFAGWVEQRVRRRVYIELKLECTRNRSRDVHKARDDWICLYCKASFPSKLRLTDHRVVGCPCGPVDSSGAKWELPVYPNLKTAKQGKDLKLALQRCDGSIWDNVHDNSIWLELNPELREPTLPPAGARVQVRLFFEPTLEMLAACPSKAGGSQQADPPPSRSPKPGPATSTTPIFVDLEQDGNDDDEPPRPHSRKRPRPEMEADRPKKRAHAPMVEGHGVKFRHPQRKPDRSPPRRSAGAELPRPNPPRNPVRASRPLFAPPPHPLRVEPIQARSPSPDRVAILAPPTLVPHAAPVTSAALPTPIPHAAPVTSAAPPPGKGTSRGENDVATRLRKERQAFYAKAASAARSSVTMDTPKPTLRPQVQPPGLFHLLVCGLLTFDLECGDFPAFLGEVENWKNDPSFMDRLFAAYGRFYSPDHQVHLLVFRDSLPSFHIPMYWKIVVTCAQSVKLGLQPSCPLICPVLGV